MKVIGLIGGMSWNSTLTYYRLINEEVSNRLGGFHSARLVLYSLDFKDIELAQNEARWDDATNILIEAGIGLRQAGADFLVICSNTMHKIADLVANRINLPLIHIGDVVGTAVNKLSLTKVGLLGTRFVMDEDFYRDRLEKYFAVEVIIPPEEEQNVIDQIIYNELCHGKIASDSRRVCLHIIEMLIKRGAEGIILGCTELPLLVRPENILTPLFDTTQLHAIAAVEMALGN